LLGRAKESAQVEGALKHFVTIKFFLWWGDVSPMPNPQAGGPSLVGCPRLLIQYICSYPPYLEAIRNLRTRHAVVTRDPPDIDNKPSSYVNIESMKCVSSPAEWISAF
jgi:hypothetical protein